MRITKAVCAGYVVACLGALLLVPASVSGAWTPANALGLPWSLLAARVADVSVIGRVVLSVAAMVLNLAIIFAIGRWMARQSWRQGASLRRRRSS